MVSSMEGGLSVRWHAICLLALGWVCSVAPAAAQPPPDYSLQQNDPNPFCGSTAIRFALPVQAEGTLAVWDPDSTQAIRTLVQGMLPAGYHEVVWDGRDDLGSILANGSYPYVLTVVEVPGQPPAFTASFRATIDCPTPTRIRSWGVLRNLYRHLPGRRGPAPSP
jgi:hypothetical protein